MALGACSVMPGKQLVFGFPARNGVPELRGVLEDKTGTVTHVTTIEEVDPVPPIDRGLTILGDANNSLIVYWMDGCEEGVDIEVADTSRPASPDINVTLTPGVGACDLVGIRRYVRIRFAGPVNSDQTSVRFVDPTP